MLDLSFSNGSDTVKNTVKKFRHMAWYLVTASRYSVTVNAGFVRDGNKKPGNAPGLWMPSKRARIDQEPPKLVGIGLAYPRSCGRSHRGSASSERRA
jgi:hypothetical protein